MKSVRRAIWRRIRPATHATRDPDPFLLKCQNGTVDLRTGELLEHRPDRWQSKLAPVAYDPTCPTPVWDAVLERVFRGDRDLVVFVQRAVGLSLVGKVVEHVLLVMYGRGGNGTRRFIDVGLRILGEYGRTASIDLFTDTTTIPSTRRQSLNSAPCALWPRVRHGGSRLDETMIKG